MKAIVSEKGQVTIPKMLRESLGIRPGDVIEFREEEGGRLIGKRVVTDDPFKNVRRIAELPDGMSVDEFIDDIRGGPYDL